MQFRSSILAVLCTLAIVLPAPAHHSQAMYEVGKWTVIEGTIKQVHWVFPHAWIFLEVKDAKGEVETWALEGANPNAIRETGVERDHVRPGDRIRARCHPLKDGDPGCVLGFVTPMHGDTARGHGVERAWN